VAAAGRRAVAEAAEAATAAAAGKVGVEVATAGADWAEAEAEEAETEEEEEEAAAAEVGWVEEVGKAAAALHVNNKIAAYTLNTQSIRSIRSRAAHLQDSSFESACLRARVLSPPSRLLRAAHHHIQQTSVDV
jgi:hypothetical protein